jgi:hypothetical protein
MISLSSREKVVEPTTAYYALSLTCANCLMALCYRGLAKNANRAFAMLAAINIFKHGRPLTGEVRQA